MPGLNKTTRREAMMTGLLVTVIGIVLAVPSVFAVYGFTDDYSLLWKATQDGFREGQNGFLYLGRPVTSILVIPALKMAGSVAHLGWLRLCSLGGLVLFAWLLDGFLRKQEWGPLPRLVTGVLTIASPAAAVWIGWAVCFPYFLGAVFALTAGMLCVSGEEKPGKPWIPYALSVLLLSLSLATYQPAASAFLIPLGVLVWQAPRAALIRRMAIPLAVFLGTHLAYFAGFQLLHTAPAGGNGLSQKTLVGQVIFESLMTFVTDVLPSAFTFWGVLTGPILAIAFGVLALLAFIPALGSTDCSTRREGYLGGILRTGFFGAFLCLSVASIIATEGVFYYRTQFGLYAVIAVGIGEGLRRAVRWQTQWRWVSLVAGAACTAFSVVGAGNGLWFCFVRPNASEYAAVREAVTKANPASARALLLIYANSRSSVEDKARPRGVHEFGTTAIDVSWALEPMVREILYAPVDDTAISDPASVIVLPVRVRELEERYPSAVVDAGGVERYDSISQLIRVADGQETILGNLMALPGSSAGWVLSADFGFLNTTYWDPLTGSYVYHLDLGWMMVAPQENKEAGLNFYHEDAGWIWTSSAHYPNLFLTDLEKWAYVQSDPEKATQLIYDETKPIILSQVGFDSFDAMGDK